MHEYKTKWSTRDYYVYAALFKMSVSIDSVLPKDTPQWHIAGSGTEPGTPDLKSPTLTTRPP